MWDKLGFAVSVLALVVSGLTYYASVEKTDSLIFRLVEANMTERDGKAISATFVFSNSGNLPYLISEIQIVASYGDDRGTSYPAEGRGLVAGPPFVLAKGEMRMVETMTQVIDFSPVVPQSLPVHLIANITAVDVEGKVHKSEVLFASSCVQSGMLINGDVESDKIVLSDTKAQKSRSNPCLK